MILLAVGCKPEKPVATDRAKEARARVAMASSAQPGEEQPGAEPEDSGLTDEQRAIVVARVGDVTLTLRDVERQLSHQPSFARARYRTFDKKVEFLNNLVQFELLAMEAQKAGYDTDPDVVLAKKRAMIQKYSQNELQREVTASAITDEDIQRYYENNKPMFQKPEQVRVSHILFDSEEAAQKALADLKASIEADAPRARVIFSDFARRLSKDDATARLNGDLNFFARDGYVDPERAKSTRLPEPVVEAAFELDRMNAISDVVKSEQGWHILQLTNKRPAVNRSVDDARRQITNILLRQRKDEAREAFIQKLRDQAKVEVFEDQLKKLDVDKVETARPHERVDPTDPPEDEAPEAEQVPAGPKLQLDRARQLGNPMRNLRLPPGSKQGPRPEGAVDEQKQPMPPPNKNR